MSEPKTAGLRCKPGDLAIVTRCGVPERIGLLVRVIERCQDGGYDWLTEVQGPGYPGRDLRTGEKGLCKETLVHDWNLTPIRGTPIDSDVNTEEPNQYDNSNSWFSFTNLHSSLDKEAA